MQIKRPSKSHRRFRILSPTPTGTTTLQSPELEAINQEYLAGRLDPDRAIILVRDLVRRLTPPPVHSWLPENKRMAEAYIQAVVVPRDRRRVSPRDARDRVYWAIRHLGATSLLTASPDELHAALGHLNARQRQRATYILNGILRWAALGKVIITERVPRKEPEYLSPLELSKVVGAMAPLHALCVKAAFGCGGRYGELFALTEMSLREQGTHVAILGQMKRGWVWWETKNRKTGTAYVIPEMREALKEWIAVPVEDKQAMRRSGTPGEEFRRACVAALGRDLNFHKIRHSYANYMLRRGANLDDLVAWMRDSRKTIETYYLSWVQTSDDMKSNVNRWG